MKKCFSDAILEKCINVITHMITKSLVVWYVITDTATQGGIFMLLEDALQEFLLDSQIRQLSERTIKSNRNNVTKMINYIRSEYGVKTLEEVKSVHLKGYIQYLIKLKRKRNLY